MICQQLVYGDTQDIQEKTIVLSRMAIEDKCKQMSGNGLVNIRVEEIVPKMISELTCIRASAQTTITIRERTDAAWSIYLGNWLVGEVFYDCSSGETNGDVMFYWFSDELATFPYAYLSDDVEFGNEEF